MNVSAAKIIAASSHELLDVLEERCRQTRAGRRQPIAALRPDARRLEAPHHSSVVAHAVALEHEDVVHADDVAFHAGDFRYLCDAAAAVGETRHLQDEIDRRRDLLPYGALGDV